MKISVNYDIFADVGDIFQQHGDVVIAMIKKLNSCWYES